MSRTANNLQLFGLDLGQLARRWWAGLQQMMPADADGIFLHPSPRVRVYADGDCLRFVRVWPEPVAELASLSTSELELLQPDALRAQLTGDVPANMLQLDLVLPDTWGMQKDVQLPRALGSDLRAAMMFQISRLTPFRPEQVFYDVQVVEAPGAPAGQTVAARLQLVLRNRVEPLLAQVQRLSGLQVSRIQLAGQDTPAGGSFNLLGRNGVNTRWWRRLNTNSWLVAGVCAAALLAAAMTPLKLRTMMVERKHEIVRLSGELADLREAKLGLDQDLQLLDYTREKKALSGNYALAFSELTRLLPDNTYLNSVKISKGNVQISGLGHDVVKLVDIFNESDVFTNAKFTSAVSRSSNNMDLFSIGMQLRQAVEEE